MMITDQVKDLVSGSRKVKQDKKDFAKRESGQLAKDVASYLCRGTRIKIPTSRDLGIVRVDTTCSGCGDRSGEAFIIKGKKLCRKCKIKTEQKK